MASGSKIREKNKASVSESEQHYREILATCLALLLGKSFFHNEVTITNAKAQTLVTASFVRSPLIILVKRIYEFFLLSRKRALRQRYYQSYGVLRCQGLTDFGGTRLQHPRYSFLRGKFRIGPPAY